MRFLDDEEPKGVVSLNDATTETLRSEHPESSTPKQDTLLHGTHENVNPIIYQSIDASVIQKAALLTKGAAGPSDMAAYSWRRIIMSRMFLKVTDDICKSIAAMDKRLCSIEI